MRHQFCLKRKDQKTAILFIGLPGSGKSTFIHNHVTSAGDGSQYTIVDADKIKETHPDYDPNNTEKVHEWSVKQAEEEMNRLSDEGKDICMDSGGVNNSYSLRIINMLKSKDYFIILIHMNTPLDICLERNSKRERKVPEEAIIKKSLKINECVEKQKVLANAFFTF